MEEVLEALAEVPGVQGCLVVGRDGLVIAGAGETGEDPDLAGVTAADLFGGAETALTERLTRGGVDTLSLEAGEGSLLLRPIDAQTFLLVLAEASPNLGLVRYESRRAVDKLREAL